ncbi:MAG: replicative DNA helicase, partial [Rhodocyclaceae bacterium]|nr:replicative DNA helicase [Rhodocyclaceae bacterium]
MAQARVFTPTPAGDPQLAALKLPPHSIEAEQSLLGGLLLDNTAWDRIADQVSESDFYRDDHRRIFRHIARLIEAVRPADVVTVGDEIAASALNPAGREAKSLLDEAESKVFEIKDAGARTTEGFTAIQPLLGQVVDR